MIALDNAGLYLKRPHDSDKYVYIQIYCKVPFDVRDVEKGNIYGVVKRLDAAKAEFCAFVDSITGAVKEELS